jgi:hypothetical protein
MAQIVRVAHNSVGAKWEGQMHSPGWVDSGHGRRRRARIVGLAIGPVMAYSGTQRVNSETLVPSSSRTANARMALSPVHSASLEPAGRTVSWTAATQLGFASTQARSVRGERRCVADLPPTYHGRGLASAGHGLERHPSTTLGRQGSLGAWLVAGCWRRGVGG